MVWVDKRAQQPAPGNSGVGTRGGMAEPVKLSGITTRFQVGCDLSVRDGYDHAAVLGQVRGRKRTENRGPETGLLGRPKLLRSDPRGNRGIGFGFSAKDAFSLTIRGSERR